MSQIKTLNGVQYTLPQYNDTGWGANTGQALTQYIAAIADVTLQLSGGAFTLTADTNFGATYGLVSTYFKSRTANIASAGQIRLANTDTVKFRNTLNDADLSIAISSNRLTFEGSRLIIAGAAEIVNADVSASAAIAYSKLALTGSILNADINAAAAIAYSKLALTGSILNADINAAAAIAYSKLALTGSILNADVNASAAIAVSKLAALTVSRAVVTDGSGFVSAATTTATEIGYVNGVTSALQTQLNAKAATTLSNVASVSADVPLNSHKFTGLSAGSAAGDSLRFEQMKVIQIVTATSVTSFSTTSATFQTSNLAASITPTSASNKILIIASFPSESANAAASNWVGSLFRGATNLGDATYGFGLQIGTGASTFRWITTFNYIDSPATTSSTTYSVKVRADGGTSVVVGSNGAIQSIILMEVVA